MLSSIFQLFVFVCGGALISHCARNELLTEKHPQQQQVTHAMNDIHSSSSAAIQVKPRLYVCVCVWNCAKRGFIIHKLCVGGW